MSNRSESDQSGPPLISIVGATSYAARRIALSVAPVIAHLPKAGRAGTDMPGKIRPPIQGPSRSEESVPRHQPQEKSRPRGVGLTDAASNMTGAATCE